MIIIKNKIIKILIYWKVQLCEGGSCLMQMQRGSANAPCHSLFLLFLFGNHHHHNFPHCWWQRWWWQIRWKQQRWALKGSAAAQSGHGGQAGKSNHLSILTTMMMMIMMMTILMTDKLNLHFWEIDMINVCLIWYSHMIAGTGIPFGHIHCGFLHQNQSKDWFLIQDGDHDGDHHSDHHQQHNHHHSYHDN